MKYLDCDFTSDVDPTWASNTSVFANCNASDDSISFNFGIYKYALTTGAVSTSFFRKYFYSLWWGLQNLRYDITIQVNSQTRSSYYDKNIIT